MYLNWKTNRVGQPVDCVKPKAQKWRYYMIGVFTKYNLFGISVLTNLVVIVFLKVYLKNALLFW